jgi:hypothetical protein
MNSLSRAWPSAPPGSHGDERRDHQAPADPELLGHPVAGLALDPCVEAVDPGREG